MPENKTHYTAASVTDFLAQLKDTNKFTDSEQLIAIMEEISGEKARMFGSSIIGFRTYSYQYASGHKGVAPLIGFSPRSAAFSLYGYIGIPEHEYLLADLGKFKVAKACIYFKKLSDINISALKTLLGETIQYLANHYTRIAPATNS